MGLTKINKIIKKYKELHKRHEASWDDANKRIAIASKKIEDKMNDPEHIYICEKTYRKESYDHQLKGNKLFNAMMKELEGLEIFPKKEKANKQSHKS